jgi:tetratricopeptide (TPR) repeat protein
VEDWRAFGIEVQRLRGTESMRALAKRVSYSAASLSRLERGLRWPSPTAVRALDQALAAGGKLVEMAVTSTFELDSHTSAATKVRRFIDVPLANGLAERLAETRRLEDLHGSAHVLPQSVTHATQASALATEARGAQRDPMVATAAEWEQFTGWLHASLGRHDDAIAHYRASLELATEAGDPDTIATALAMRGHVAWMMGEIGPTVGLSRAAQRHARSRTVLALAVQQEGRGLAMDGDIEGMERKLDRAAELLAQGDPDRPDAQYFYGDAYLEMQRGMAYRIGGRYDDAIASLERGLKGFDSEIAKSEWATWYVAELAAACAGAGYPDVAAGHAAKVLPLAFRTEGTRLVKFIEDLQVRMAQRWPSEPTVIKLGQSLLR